MNNSTFDLIVSCIAIAIFVGYTAYDVQQILKMQEFNVLPEDNLAIYGALELYLDFINLFLRLLQLFGRSDDYSRCYCRYSGCSRCNCCSGNCVGWNCRKRLR